MTASKKLELLQSCNEDCQWYPTTEEIIEALKNDLLKYGITYYNELIRSEIKPRKHYNEQEGQETYSLSIDTMLDIGAGDGRVLKALKANKKYAIEIAQTQADDLIRQGIFLIGRDFYKTSLSFDKYGVVFCNPPYSTYEDWAKTIIQTSNFDVLYLVLPIRWENTNIKNIIDDLKYEYSIVGQYDFSNADREARAKVHLIRINAKWKNVSRGDRNYTSQETIIDAFERWVTENIADFSEAIEEDYKVREETHLSLVKKPIDKLLDDYEEEKKILFEAFKTIGKLPINIIQMFGQDKKSMIETLRKSIKNLKYKYWKACFSQLEIVRNRMTRKTVNDIFQKILEFGTLDFNVENVYSIIIWIINNTNIGITEQICDVFEKMAKPDYIKAYKSNKHWEKGDWDYRNEGKYTLGDLDYRVVFPVYAESYCSNLTILDDFIVVCKNLGFVFADNTPSPNLNLSRELQTFYLANGEVAFTLRYYSGNKNAHLKISKNILMKFNIEVAKIKKWVHSAEQASEEMDIPKDEAAALWNASLQLIGKKDLTLIDFVAG